MDTENSIHKLSILFQELLWVKSEKKLYEVLEKIQKHEIV
jgi:hypothetical protein